MSGRYVYEHRKKGDVASASPEALDAGKKLLGYLAEQRRLGLAKTLVAQATTADGSVVTARFVGNMPEVSIRSSPPRPSKVLAQTLEGFVTKPRKFGTQGTQNNGQNAFGQHAHVLLQTKGAGAAQEWRSLFYDATYVPTGYPLRVFGTFQGKTLLATGLAAHGNVDWRGKDEAVSITWIGNPSRTWLVQGGFEGYRGGSGRIYHNGKLILNHTLTYTAPHEGWVAEERVAGACLRRAGRNVWLVYVTRPGLGSDETSTDDYPIRVYRVPLVPDRLAFPWMRSPQADPLLAPQFVAAAIADVEKIGELVMPRRTGINASSQGLATAFFNQSGSQARGILVREDNNAGTAGDESRVEFVEVVIDLAEDLASASITTQSHGELYYTVQTDDTFESVMPAFYNQMDFHRDTVLAPLPAAGTYEIAYSPEYEVVDAYLTGAKPYLFIETGTRTVTTAPVSEGPFPIGVDFQDDVPVYLWWTPETTQQVATRAATWTQEETGTKTATEIYDGSSGLPTGGSSTIHRENTASASSNVTVTTTITGGSVYAEDQLGVRWLDVNTDRSFVATEVISADLALVADSTTGKTSDYTDSRTMADPNVDVKIVLWWVDLRSRSATYSKNTTTTGTNLASTTVGVTGGDFEPYAEIDLNTTSEQTTLKTYAIAAEAIFYGEVVRSMSSLRDLPTVVPSSSSTSLIYTPIRVADVTFNSSTIGLDSESPQSTFGLHPDAIATYDTFKPDGPGPFTTPADLTQRAALSPQSAAQNELSTGAPPARGLFLTSNFTTPVQAAAITGVDFEPTSTSSDFYPRYDTRWGSWIAHKGAWAYSMYDLDRDIFSLSYASQIQGGDLELVSGARGAECFEQMWPLSTCLVNLKESR